METLYYQSITHTMEQSMAKITQEEQPLNKKGCISKNDYSNFNCDFSICFLDSIHPAS
jgi:hypothetical protein